MKERAALTLVENVGNAEPILEMTLDEETDLLAAQVDMSRGEYSNQTEVELMFTK